MATIPVGAKRQESLLVTGENAVNFLGREDARVLSTPHLIAYLEMTARNLAKQFLGHEEDTVGTHVDVRHLAATPIGMSVNLHAEVLSAEERRVRFRVEAWDEREKVGEGTHERFIINLERFAGRVQAKAGTFVGRTPSSSADPPVGLPSI